MTEVEYVGNWPDDVKITVALAFDKYICLIPGWCRSLYVRFENEGTEHQAAAVAMSYESRHVNVYIRPNWFMEEPDERERVLLHEIAHIHIQPTRTVFVGLIEDLDDRFKKFAWERYKEAWEGAVEDLAWALHEAMKQ